MVNNLLDGALVWSTIGSVALAILVLLVMITVHEFGHYVVGKRLGFKINEFSIGFGPAIFKRTNKKTGELFSLRLIPLGGYCAFE
ncbi:MAG: site-2 protease family protein, partial [Clostridia bacterium]|nr:site-2 protease family protein [Clostridia bacterium]